MLKTTERWRSRSSIAAATVGSSKMRPQFAMRRFVVCAIEPRPYLWLMTGKSPFTHRVSLVSDRPVAGDCRARSYQIGRTDLVTGSDASVLMQPDRDRTLDRWILSRVPNRRTAGSSLDLAGNRSDFFSSLVRAVDGAVLHLPRVSYPDVEGAHIGAGLRRRSSGHLRRAARGRRGGPGGRSG